MIRVAEMNKVSGKSIIDIRLKKSGDVVENVSLINNRCVIENFFLMRVTDAKRKWPELESILKLPQ